ncbi:hypothetical protein BATDEDRAFT_26606 [Batrachochytrium dendrobatidis JAM81]|uniref:OmpH family outer membrane protein n=2 Tax=Batrachochytrium dendrobatidis TaxID=109871 RepID=F4P7R5_BATDJ|nr:uncharacterized protein BATDEDRAFT_26606 [Batrachochytrium dendrobatidis JAM81]EGF78705.1 hypothetical protein BATDEDRAFT_26606 [Batrachochytrium dendrobatidis JAM81]KAK5664784.1 hypothetical protein QVD99_008329 [Batrachochytrium dendrobatidis]OAJ43639.1 hypothetical protein BDEG_26981 [Batrachochytrium dendrobatidis JEL423]|eukprot:XP_006680713.1 hypothetical protein BATDEDRAFT_26606 [Batrachochytrium dendrobatidis JAM81]
MKLSIAVLSSILAICSVTVSNPVDPSSTTSIEPTSTLFPGLYHQYLSDCHPFTLNEIVLIKQYADVKHKLNQEAEEIDLKESRVEEQKELLDEQRRSLRLLQGHPTSTNQSVPNYELNIFQTQSGIETSHTTLKNLEEELSELYEIHLKVRKEWTELQSKLYGYLVKHGTTGVIVTGAPNLELYPEFMKCFGVFYDGSSQ